MENNVYHLDLFTNCMIQYFNEVLIHKNYVSNSFRKYFLKNGEDAEFSFQIKVPTPSTDYDEFKLNVEKDSTFFTEEDFEKLINFSQLWSLHLANASIKGNKLIFKLNQPLALYRVLKSILNEQANYGINFTLPQRVKVNIHEEQVEDLTQFRLRLIKRTIENILKSFKTEGERCSDEYLEICLTTKLSNDSENNVLCGVVTNEATGRKETKITPEKYYKIRLNDMRLISEHKHWQTKSDQVLHHLADASVTMALLEMNPKRAASLRMGSGFDERGKSSGRGASFVLYNCARMASIRNTFRKKREENIYPEPPSLEDLDFSLLNEQEEWFILFNFLLEYPTMIRKITEDLYRGIVNVHKICSFLSNLSSLFSVYYARVRILLEPREHLLPIIFARLQLLKATEQVMQNALTFLNIETLEEM